MTDDDSLVRRFATMSDMVGAASSAFEALDRPASTALPKLSHMADTVHDRLEKTIAAFEVGLAADEEVGACLAQFGQAMTIRVEQLGFRNPHLVIFTGVTEAGDRCQLVQHMSQVNVLLVALKAKSQPARRMGFRKDDDPKPDEE